MTGGRDRTVLAATIAAALAVVPIGAISVPAGFLLAAYLPGRELVRRLAATREWSPGCRTLIALAASLAIVPVVLNPIWHATHGRWATLAATWGLVVASAALRRGRPLFESDPSADRLFEMRHTRWAAVFAAAIIVCGCIFTYWPTELLGYPVATQIHDFVKHYAVMDSLGRRPLPLGNVFYAEGADAPVYYYHFFYLIPATVRLWSGHAVGIELAFGVQAALVGLASVGLVYVVVKRFAGEQAATLAAALASVIGGLDAIPVIGMFIRGDYVVTLDAWAVVEFRIHNFLSQVIWSPQNCQGAMIALLSVWMLSTHGLWRGWWAWGPLLGASCLGSSIWVSLGVLPAVSLWVVIELWRRRRDGRACARLLAAATGVAALMLIISLPSLMGYAEMSARHGRSLTSQWDARHNLSVLGRLAAPGVLANVLDYPMILALEYGAKIVLPLMLPWTVWRRVWRDDGLRLWCIASAIALIGYPVLRSNFYYNDFGQKISLLPLTLGAALAGCVVAATPGPRRWWNPLGWSLGGGRADGRSKAAAWIAGALLVAGLPVGIYEIPATFGRRYIEEWLASRGSHGAELRDERAALSFMRHELPADAVVQADVTPARAKLAQLVRRQIGVMEPQDDVLVFRPADYDRYLECAGAVRYALYESALPGEVYAILRRHRVTHVYAGPIERRRWSGIEKLYDARYFRTVFDTEYADVVELRAAVSTDQ